MKVSVSNFTKLHSFVACFIIWALAFSLNIVMFAYKFGGIITRLTHGLAPNYLRTLLQSYIPSRSLRSETGNLLIMPKARRKLGCQSFAVAAPKLWNDLPVNIRTTTSIVSFRSSLKTHLFKLAYAWFVQYHHFTNCCFYLIYNYVQYIYLFFIFTWTYIYFYFTRCKAQLNNCFDWILWRYINKNYYYYYYINVLPFTHTQPFHNVAIHQYVNIFLNWEPRIVPKTRIKQQ